MIAIRRAPGRSLSGPSRLAPRLLARCLLALGLLVGAGLRPAAGVELIDREWVTVEAPHFTVVGRVSRRDARALAEELELFRKVVLSVANTPRDLFTVPTRVVVVEEASEWGALGADRHVGGVLFPSLREHLMVVRDFDDPVGAGAVRGDYVRLVLHNQARLRAPRWYDQGFAELLATVDREGDAVVIGSAPRWRAQPTPSLPWLPVRRVVAPDGYLGWPSDRQAAFALEAWALVHYLVLGGEYADSFTRRFAAYTGSLEAGTEPAAAFETAFEVDLTGLDRKLRGYLAAGRFPGFKLPVSRFDPIPRQKAEEAALVDVAVTVGRVRLALGDLEAARVSFDRVVAVAPKDARGPAGLGALAQAAQRFDDADAHFVRAIELAPDDPHTHLDRAALRLARAAASPGGDARRADIERAREHCARAWQLDGKAPEVYARYGQSYLLAGDDPARAVEMLEEAERLLPASLPNRLHLAEAYLAAGRADAAARMARSVLLWSHRPTDETRRARALLDAMAAESAPADEGATPPGAP
jgi:tetratricopeptide (TPR) repeat protein